MSQFLRNYLATKLTLKRSISDPEKLNTSIRSANVDLNPHQVDAAVFAFNSPLSRGAILADEVGQQFYSDSMKRRMAAIDPVLVSTTWPQFNP